MRPAAMKMHVSRKRKRDKPPAPLYFFELANMIKKFSKTVSLFRGNIECKDGSAAVMLCEEKLMEHIGEVEEIHIQQTHEV